MSAPGEFLRNYLLASWIASVPCLTLMSTGSYLQVIQIIIILFRSTLHTVQS